MDFVSHTTRGEAVGVWGNQSGSSGSSGKLGRAAVTSAVTHRLENSHRPQSISIKCDCGGARGPCQNTPRCARALACAHTRILIAVHARQQ